MQRYNAWGSGWIMYLVVREETEFVDEIRIYDVEIGLYPIFML